jgi:hypothetical protein
MVRVYCFGHSDSLAKRPGRSHYGGKLARSPGLGIAFGKSVWLREPDNKPKRSTPSAPPPAMMRPPVSRGRLSTASTTVSVAGGDLATVSRRPRSASAAGTAARAAASGGPASGRPGWDVKGKMADEKRKVSVLKAQLQEKEEELAATERKLRESSESVADFEKMLDGLYTRLEAKETQCRELQEEANSSREQIGRLTTTLDSLRREHDSLVGSADTLSEQIINQKREQVRDTVQLYMAQLPSTLHKYRYVELQGKLDALFVSPAT